MPRFISQAQTFGALNDFIVAPSNKSLDASGGSVFRIMTGPAMLD